MYFIKVPTWQITLKKNEEKSLSISGQEWKILFFLRVKLYNSIQTFLEIISNKFYKSPDMTTDFGEKYFKEKCHSLLNGGG